MLHENSKDCSVDFDYDAIDEDLDGPAQPASETERLADALEFGRRIVSLIRTRPRARLTAECLHLALGDADLEGVTMTDVAKACGVTKAAVSKRVKEIREHLHLRPTANNKSDHARRVYARTNRSPIRLDPQPHGSRPA